MSEMSYSGKASKTIAEAMRNHVLKLIYIDGVRIAITIRICRKCDCLRILAGRERLEVDYKMS